MHAYADPLTRAERNAAAVVRNGRLDAERIADAKSDLIAARSRDPSWVLEAMDHVCRSGQNKPTYKLMVKAMMDGDFAEVGRLYCSMVDIELAERVERDIEQAEDDD